LKIRLKCILLLNIMLLYYNLIYNIIIYSSTFKTSPSLSSIDCDQFRYVKSSSACLLWTRRRNAKDHNVITLMFYGCRHRYSKHYNNVIVLFAKMNTTRVRLWQAYHTRFSYGCVPIIGLKWFATTKYKPKYVSKGLESSAIWLNILWQYKYMWRLIAIILLFVKIIRKMPNRITVTICIKYIIVTG